MVMAVKIQTSATPLGVISLYGLAGAFVAFGLAVILIRRHE